MAYVAHTDSEEILDHTFRQLRTKRFIVDTKRSIPPGVEPNKNNIIEAFNTLKSCDCIVMPAGWEKDSLARIEHSLASFLGLAIFYP